MDRTVWLAYATAVAIDRKDGKPEAAFQRELQAWGLAFDVAAELEEAIFLLLYKEAYRPDFEAWKTAHPQAIPDFAEKWRLMP